MVGFLVCAFFGYYHLIWNGLWSLDVVNFLFLSLFLFLVVYHSFDFCLDLCVLVLAWCGMKCWI